MTDAIATCLAGGFPARVDAAVILGSGLGGFADRLDRIAQMAYADIPGFPEVTVSGHDGALIAARLEGKTVLVFSGRFHHYEGHGYETAVLPVRMAAAFGAGLLVVSNAAGGIHRSFRVGDIMLIDDLMRIGFPVSAPGSGFRTRYPEPRLLDHAVGTARGLGIALRQGTYLYVKGPVYETPAEIRAYRTLGADAVGMSTMPELLEAGRAGVPAIGFSLVTNMATGVTGEKLAHADIQQVAERRKADFTRLVTALIATW
jgi:purine-nucleoside phosphorylase